MLAEGVRWFDDWFALEQLAPGITAIGEPRFHQINWNYLIEGNDRALLFDTGPGVRDISAVTRALTSRPLQVLASHLHFDHTGNLHRFANIAMSDLPELRACEREGSFNASDELFLGFCEGMVWKPLKVSHWLPIGSTIDLGGRKLELLHTPGHSPDSVSLRLADEETFFAADFVYLGPLYAQIPGADLAAYLKTAEHILPLLTSKTRIFCAHGAPDQEGNHRAPMLGRSDIADLVKALISLRQSGKRPASWPINEHMHLLLWEKAFASWQAT